MKRRSFLQAGTLIAASGASNLVRAKAKVAPLRIGLIGAGQRGAGLAHLVGGIEGMTIIAVAETLSFRAEEAKQYLPANTRFYSNYQDLLDNKKVDAVIVATPFSTHASIAKDAIAAGKHVYCEKTMAKGVDDIITLREHATKSDSIFQVGFQYRSVPVYQKIIELAQSGKVGTLTHIQHCWNRNSDWRREVPDEKLERLINWRLYREYSGGLVAELCSHQIDYTNWLLGSPPEKITGVGSINYWKDGRETYDNVQVLASYPGGINVDFKSRLSNASGGRSTKIHGDKGTIILENEKAWFYSEKKDWKPEKGIVDGVTGATVPKKYLEKAELLGDTDVNPTRFALQEFKTSIDNSTQPHSTAETGATASFVVDMALKAMLNNTVQTWDSNYDKK